MTKWRINVSRGFGFGVGLMSFITLANAALIGVAASRPVSFGTFIVGWAVLLGFGLVGLVAYWVYGLVAASYLLDRNTLNIRWGTSEQVIPMRQIERVFTGDEIEGKINFYGGRWPGHWVGYGDLPEAGEVLFYATVPPRKQIFVVTPGLAYGISPSHKAEFLRSLQKRLQMGPTQLIDQASRRPTILDWSIWQDWLGLALFGAGTLAIIILVGLLCFRFPALPLLVPLHFGSSGSPDRLGPRAEIFLMPLIGVLTQLVNAAVGGLLYRHDRVASYLLWGGAVVVQVLVWTAAMGVLVRA